MTIPQVHSGQAQARSEMQIYVSRSGQRYGPYSLDELRSELEAEIFRPDNFASIDNCHTWQPISALPGIGSVVCRVEVDPARNLLVVTYRGRVAASALSACLTEIEDALTSLGPGFRLLVDLTALEWMDPGCAGPLRQIMQICNRKGVSRVVRVIPRPERDIGLGIMSYFHYGPHVQVGTCSTLEQAHDLLKRD